MTTTLPRLPDADPMSRPNSNDSLTGQAGATPPPTVWTELPTPPTTRPNGTPTWPDFLASLSPDQRFWAQRFGALAREMAVKIVADRTGGAEKAS